MKGRRILWHEILNPPTRVGRGGLPIMTTSYRTTRRAMLDLVHGQSLQMRVEMILHHDRNDELFIERSRGLGPSRRLVHI